MKTFLSIVMFLFLPLVVLILLEALANHGVVTGYYVMWGTMLTMAVIVFIRSFRRRTKKE